MNFENEKNNPKGIEMDELLKYFDPRNLAWMNAFLSEPYELDEDKNRIKKEMD